MNSIRILLIALPLLVLTSCNKDKPKDISAVKITRVQITDYPHTNAGAAWDSSSTGITSGPDVQWKIVGPDTLNAVNTIYNATDPVLNFGLADALFLREPNSIYTMQLWDIDNLNASDTLSENDLMSSVNFIGWAHAEDVIYDTLLLSGGLASYAVYVEFIYK